MQKILSKYDVRTVGKDECLQEVIGKMKTLLQVNEFIAPEHNMTIKQDFIILLEGLRLRAYYEKTSVSVCEQKGEQDGCIAVGCGFNMSRPDAKREWLAVFDEQLFDDVYKGKKELTENQVRDLLAYSIELRSKELRKLLPEFSRLAINVQLAVESVYYNSPALFKKSKFLNCITLYSATGESVHLYQAALELLKYKHSVLHEAINRRRRVECLMLCGCDQQDILESKIEQLFEFLPESDREFLAVNA